MKKNTMTQEPLFWMMLAFTLAAIASVLLIDLAADGSAGSPLPNGVVKRGLLPIYLPVIGEMIAFFFALNDAEVQALMAHNVNEARKRVAIGCSAVYGIFPIGILLGDKKEVTENLATFQLVALPIFAAVVAYYFGGKLKALPADASANPQIPVLPQPVLPQPVLPQPVLPQPVLPQPVLPQPVQSDRSGQAKEQAESHEAS